MSDHNQTTLESQLFENVGYDEEIKIRLGDIGLVVTRTHFRDGARTQMERVFAKEEYDQARYSRSDLLANTLWNMAVELRSIVLR